ncbi:hypothetical protein K523DRAFT_135811 [Schizophyllum commune Tattone D]|nr:hypothetical protein K523DRAFT_135811 [Schizophyllum commune Tattone D]
MIPMTPGYLMWQTAERSIAALRLSGLLHCPPSSTPRFVRRNVGFFHAMRHGTRSTPAVQRVSEIRATIWRNRRLELRDCAASKTGVGNGAGSPFESLAGCAGIATVRHVFRASSYPTIATLAIPGSKTIRRGRRGFDGSMEARWWMQGRSLVESAVHIDISCCICCRWAVQRCYRTFA